MRICVRIPSSILYLPPNCIPMDIRGFLFKPMEVLIEDESKLTLHGLSQYYVKLNDKDKNNKCNKQ